MSDEIEMMKCDWCGKEFPADARCCMEGGIHAYHTPQDGEEWKGEEPIELPPGHFEATDMEAIKKEYGLNEEQLNQLLTTGSVEGLGTIVCMECQQAGMEYAESKQ